MATSGLSEDAQFVAAAWRGDLDTFTRHFARPVVLDNIAFWNDVNRRSRLRLPIEPTRAPPHPWYYGTALHDFSIDFSIVRRGHVELFRWFFARPQLELLGETLRWLARDILQACLVADFAPACEMAAIFFESALFVEEMNDSERRALLSMTLHTAASRGDARWVDVLLAYGAEPNSTWNDETPIVAVANKGTTETLNVLLAHGAWIDNDRLLMQRELDRDDGLVRDLLQCGADANANALAYGNTPLHHAALHSLRSTMRLLIEEGFADVDARDVRGLTPLMAVTAMRSDHHRRRTLPPADEISQLLLDAGADLHAVDHHDRGVLHHVARHAVGARSLNCLRLFLARGANLNLQDANGETPMATLLSQARDDDMWRSVEEILLLLLHAGGDPFICDHTGRTAVQRLQGSDAGRAFLCDNSALFLHRQSCKSDAAL